MMPEGWKNNKPTRAAGNTKSKTITCTLHRNHVYYSLLNEIEKYPLEEMFFLKITITYFSLLCKQIKINFFLIDYFCSITQTVAKQPSYISNTLLVFFPPAAFFLFFQIIQGPVENLQHTIICSNHWGGPFWTACLLRCVFVSPPPFSPTISPQNLNNAAGLMAKTLHECKSHAAHVSVHSRLHIASLLPYEVVLFDYQYDEGVLRQSLYESHPERLVKHRLNLHCVMKGLPLLCRLAFVLVLEHCG